MDRRVEQEAGERKLQALAAVTERHTGQVLVAEGEDVEADQLGRRLPRESNDTGVGWMDALGQARPVESLRAGRACADYELGVDGASFGQMHTDGFDHLREVAGQRFGASTGQLDLVAVAQNDAPEAIPLGFVGKSPRDGVRGGHVGDGLGQHGGHRQFDG